MTPDRVIEFSEPAKNDLIDLLTYTWEKWGLSQPSTYAAGIERTLDNLARFPSIGRTRDDVVPGCRMITVGSHSIFYKYDTRVVTILRILHQREQLSGAFESKEQS